MSREDIENKHDWGGDEIFKDDPKFLGNPNPNQCNLTGSRGKKYQFIASLSIAASIASGNDSEQSISAHDIYNDLYTQLSMHNVRMSTHTTNAALESKKLAMLINELSSGGTIRSLSGIAISSYLEDLKLTHRISTTSRKLGEGAAIVLPFPHNLAPGMQMKKHVPVWGVLSSYPNVTLSEEMALDETTAATVIFPAHDQAVKMSIPTDSLISVIGAENRAVSDGNTGFIVAAR